MRGRSQRNNRHPAPRRAIIPWGRDGGDDLLSDVNIRHALNTGRLVIENLVEGAIQPASVDVRLAAHLRRIVRYHDDEVVRLTPDENGVRVLQPSLPDTTPYILHPGEFVLGSTIEHIELSLELVARIEGKSTLGRSGLLVHVTAGFIDPGFRGTVTLEMYNASPNPIKLTYGMFIAQIAFDRLETPCSVGYTGRYQDQADTTSAR